MVNRSIYKFLLSRDKVDKILPDTPDIEDKWDQICMAYLPDGVREFNGYPIVSLGWMMFVGMAIARYWDVDWKKYSRESDIYEKLRDARGYDNMDDYICQDVLGLNEEGTTEVSNIVADTANLVHNALLHEHFEPGTLTAFNAYVRCLHQLYYFGAAVELRRLGYHMTELPLN